MHIAKITNKLECIILLFISILMILMMNYIIQREIIISNPSINRYL